MNNVLFLDDDVQRQQRAVLKWGEQYNLYIVTTAIQCIEHLQSDIKWTIVSLDHDLGGEIYVDSNRTDCGMEVVRWMEINKPKIEMITLHSWNHSAAQQMRKKLLQINTPQYNYVFIKPFDV